MAKDPSIVTADHIKVKFPNWLWYPYIPANGATMFFGPGGIGKSYLTTELAAAFSAGRALPGQAKKQASEHKVLMLTAEDSLEAIVVPRLKAQGAKLSNIYLAKEPFVLNDRGLALLRKYIEETEATIVTIDPVAHFMGGKIDINKMNEVRALTGGLHQHGLQTDCAVMLIHHSRKSKGDDADNFEKAAGSQDFVNAVRSVMFVHKASDGTPVMSHEKTNYGVLGRSLAYYIDEDGLHWIGEYDEDSVRQQTTAGYSKRQKKEKAQAFLEVALQDGPVPSTAVVAFAQDQGIQPTTLNRAKIGVADSIMRVMPSGAKCWYWRLKGDDREPNDTG